MCRGKDMDVMVMDVEGTDGRERGEDQVVLFSVFKNNSHLIYIPRILNANLLSSLSPPRRFLLSTYGNIKLVYIKEPTWAYSRLYLKSTLAYLERKLMTGNFL